MVEEDKPKFYTSFAPPLVQIESLNSTRSIAALEINETMARAQNGDSTLQKDRRLCYLSLCWTPTHTLIVILVGADLQVELNFIHFI